MEVFKEIFKLGCSPNSSDSELMDLADLKVLLRVEIEDLIKLRA